MLVGKSLLAIHVHCHVDRYANVVVQVTDYGVGMEDAYEAVTVGKGFAVIRNFAKCDVWSTPGDRTIVRLHFKIGEGIKVDSCSK